MVKIEPLSKMKLKETVGLVNEIFLNETEEPSDEEIPASLEPEKYQDFLSKYQMSNIRYWLVINDFGKVIGVVGLYCYEFDKNEAFWLGWFCVHPEARRSGIGNTLLRFAINVARAEGKKFLRLYTSTNPNELDSHRLYEKHRLKLTKEEPYPNGEFKKLYYELKF